MYLSPCLSPMRLCLLAAQILMITSTQAAGEVPFRVEVVDRDNGWPVPLVELETVHHVSYITDNAGLIAIDAPELQGRETWFFVRSPGYEVPADGFGYRGVRLTPRPGGTARIQVQHTSLARRIGRVTGAGLFAESQKLGERLNIPESGVLGQDSLQLATHRRKLFWAWGDTSLSRYPLGVFDMTGAITELHPWNTFEPPLIPQLDYFRDDNGFPRGIARMPGTGPTWLSGFISLPDRQGVHHLVATYIKVKPPLEAYEAGLCVWNDDASRFELQQVLWTKSDDTPTSPPTPEGHPVLYTDSARNAWVLFGNPFPRLRCPATFEAWQDRSTWEVLTPQEQLVSAEDGSQVKPHTGSIAWNSYRSRWVTIFMQAFGKPSAFGELWYAEADSPFGPWGPCVKVLSHENYTFYNPRVHWELTPADAPFLLFEGTYTSQFARNPPATPRFDYNQILYRLELDDDQLAPARRATKTGD